jgi:hypothetical protein
MDQGREPVEEDEALDKAIQQAIREVRIEKRRRK